MQYMPILQERSEGDSHAIQDSASAVNASAKVIKSFYVRRKGVTSENFDI